MYDIFLDGVMFPVMPASIEMKVKNKNDTLVLLNQGEVSIPKRAGLTEFSFDLLIPGVRYPFARYEGKFRPAKYYLGKLERLKAKKRHFRLVISRQFPNGKERYATSIPVVLEEYSVTEDAEEGGLDATAHVVLKQYAPFKTQTCKIVKPKNAAKAAGKPVKIEKLVSRDGREAPSEAERHTVREGETLWTIASAYYGDSSEYARIYEANEDVFRGRSPNVLYPGEVLSIPPGDQE